jgi:signal transduction histidine kinase
MADRVVNIMAHKPRAVLSLLVLLSMPPVCRSEGGDRWRIYRVADGLGASNTLAVTISPRGNVWARHVGDSGVSWLDGFQVRTIPAAGNGVAPVYESRSGQIWSLYSSGVMEFRRGQWVEYPVTEINAENQASTARRLLIRPIPLLPAERDHVLALLSDRLIEFDAGQNRTITLRNVIDTGLGRFIDICEARDGGAWLTGSNGLAKLPGPVRRLSAETSWQEFPPDARWAVQNLERPLEDDEGGVTVVADSLSSTGRVALRFDGRDWEILGTSTEKLRGAWRGNGARIWAFTRGALLTLNDGQWRAVAIPGISSAQYYDVATEPSGVFWVATSEGLVRHAQQTWQTPAGIAGTKPPVYSILEDRAGRLWFAATEGLATFQNEKWQRVSWPAGFEPHFTAATGLFNLPDGRIVINSLDQPWLFEPVSVGFQEMKHPRGRKIRTVLGPYKDSAILVQTIEANAPSRFQLEIFDGGRFQELLETQREADLAAEPAFVRVDKADQIWLGTTAGLEAWDPKGRNFLAAKGFRGNALCFLETAGGKIWCGGIGLISEFDGRTWSVVQHGLGEANAMIQARDGSTWVATSTGVHRFADGSWVGNDVEEGLAAFVVRQLCQDHRGTIWAATSGGVSRYVREADLDAPGSFFPAADNPPEVSTAGEVMLRFHGRDKWDHTPTDRLLFTHRLDDGPWSAFTANTSVTFTNLSAGQHRLSVRAMDRNWNEESEPSVYEFAALVPWYKEPRLLAVGLCGLVVTALLGWLAVNRHLRLVRSYAEVEKIVAQRTTELERANRELLHSQKMRALGTLAAGIAHDFNNILSIIKGSAQIVEANPEDSDKIKTRIDRIKAMVEQGSGIVKAMLGFSRVDEQSGIPCDINQLISDTTKLLGDQYRQDLTLHLELAPALPKITGGSHLIQQMLLNLVSNAADAMGGHGQIHLRTGSLEELPPELVLAPAPADRYVRVSVQDTGSGIAPEVLGRIFEPFFTTKALSTRRGTGLGLSMVYEISKEMGFGLMVESVPGKGSTFTILLPVEGLGDSRT